ncbi:hypothetical protein HMJ29_11795 [Hymenobacter taeanensis]|uniref:Uncharacterized protein n=1 Tax=Hymenobacter taeanensis TaxID=2735321 RepID=A0A6M6BKJ7_9BACT|nr:MULTISPECIES: hypothetical protein [Hymenobacter]QJX47585.1 hypothetical protein HMJ29_11795 [Hymenobacter taeanensis]UOQ82931.1 hypothetical protein MUN83_09290 [Hymenobacter sp. 5414T-23]
MLSTQNYTDLPDSENLQRICKAVAALDAIVSPEPEFRYYTYNPAWDEQEAVFEMNDGEGDQMLVLFRAGGCVINGYGEGLDEPAKEAVTRGLPAMYQEFIFGEPVNSIGTTFCLWTTEQGEWQTGELTTDEDGSEDMLGIFDGDPHTYVDWAQEYYEPETLPESGISAEAVRRVYAGETLTRELVLAITKHVPNWEQLSQDLTDLQYPFNFKQQ